MPDTPKTRASQGISAIPTPRPAAIRTYLSPAEAAAVLGRSRSFVLRLVVHGDLPAVKFGDLRRGHWSIARRDLEAFVRGREAAVRQEMDRVISIGAGRRG